MSERKNMAILMGAVLSVSLLTSALTALFFTREYQRTQFEILGQVCGEILENQPETEQAILSALKAYKENPGSRKEGNILLKYGYRQTDFLKPPGNHGMLPMLLSFLTGAVLFSVTILLRRKKEERRIKALTDYLEKVNLGGSGTLIQGGEDEFSKLQDEIYKTVTMLHQTRDAALTAKNNFAENLSNIAHQIKTPLTSISLSAQRMKENPSQRHLEQIQQQLSRLTHLEEALLLLSRIDAGTLSLERKEADVFTLLTLAGDHLQALFSEKQVTLHIEESGEQIIYADPDWTMEAIINLLKNCLEHTPAKGTVCCRYRQNPLYTQIRIQDTGTGFVKEDIPHLFERFYRGHGATGEGIGIGLYLSKEIIESQNGSISAFQPPEGGACFEVRFYSH